MFISDLLRVEKATFLTPEICEFCKAMTKLDTKCSAFAFFNLGQSNGNNSKQGSVLISLMNQKSILLPRKEQRGSFLDAKQNTRTTLQSPFFQHYSTGATYFKPNSKFCFSRHMLPRTHSLSCTIFHKIVKIR